MGNFAIIIRGVGSHSVDPGKDRTAEAVAADAVLRLREHGASITDAKVVSGSEVDVDTEAFLEAARRRAERR